MTGFWWTRYKHCDRGHFGNQLTAQHIEQTLYAKPSRLKKLIGQKNNTNNDYTRLKRNLEISCYISFSWKCYAEVKFENK